MTRKTGQEEMEIALAKGYYTQRGKASVDDPQTVRRYLGPIGAWWDYDRMGKERLGAERQRWVSFLMHPICKNLFAWPQSMLLPFFCFFFISYSPHPFVSHCFHY